MHPTVLAAVSLSLLLWPSASAQEPPPRGDSTWKIAPFPPLEQRVGGTWLAHWNNATNTPEAIYGTGMPLPDWRGSSLEEARRHAERALADFRELLQLGASDFREIIGARMGNAWSFTYEQSFRGVPCIGGRADVRISKSGVLALLGSTAWQIPANFDTTPAIDEVLATARAWFKLGQLPTEVPQPGKERAPRLCIWGDVFAAELAPFHLAWEIPVSNVDREGRGPIGRYYVDAKTGDVLRYENDKLDAGPADGTDPDHAPNATAEPEPVAPPQPAAEPLLPAQPLPPVPTTVTVMAFCRTGSSATSPLVNVPLPGLVVNVPGIGARTSDANGQFTIDIAAAVTISVTALDGRHHAPIVGSSAPSASVVVTPGVAATLQILSAAATPEQAAHTNCAYWVDQANEWARGILGSLSYENIGVNVNVAGSCNAFYNGASINFYPTNASCNNTGFSTVVVHEWGHGLDDTFGTLANGLPHGLSEGWGDIVGLYLTDQPILAAGFNVGSSGGLRNGVNSTVFPSQSSDNHTCGQSWMGFAWQLRQNLRTALGTTAAVAISNDIVIGSIVADATTQPNAVLQVFVADDDDGNLLNGVPHYPQLSAAATTKGIPFPTYRPFSFVHTPIASHSNRLTPSLVNCTINNLDGGTITQARLVYSVNGGPTTTRIMIPNGQVRGFRAVLPGVLSGAVSYHLEAVSSVPGPLGPAPVGRLPLTGEFTVTVTTPPTGTFVSFFSQGFEGGSAGWAGGIVEAQNDWQLGSPFGRSGTSSGVAWADPSAPATGTASFGNDLGNTINGTMFNGSYAANVENFLRSPAINCSGRRGVTLRFRRWLTVEEGQFDPATITVNGVVVWTNPLVGHLVDTAWQTIELPIPQADNHPSVRIEWRLKTDGGMELGGWNIDDVELGTRTTTPLVAEWRMLPEQLAGGLPMTMAVQTQGPQPFIIAIGDTPGPTLIPGIPPLLVGGGTFSLNGFSNGFGQFNLGFNAPLGAPPTGILWFSQVLTLDSLGGFVTSNQHINLFTP